MNSEEFRKLLPGSKITYKGFDADIIGLGDSANGTILIRFQKGTSYQGGFSRANGPYATTNTTKYELKDGYQYTWVDVYSCDNVTLAAKPSSELFTRAKKNSKTVAYKLARMKLSQATQLALTKLLLKNPTSAKAKLLKEIFESDQGRAMIQILLGMTPHAPVVGDKIQSNKHMLAIADDCQTEGMAYLTNNVLDTLIGSMGPVVMETMSDLSQIQEEIELTITSVADSVDEEEVVEQVKEKEMKS